MAASGRPIERGTLAVVADLIVTGIFTVFLLGATESHGDAIPRPVALAALYGSTAIVGWLGVRSGRRSLLVAAALPLLPGALLSFTGVTLVFLVPALLFIVAARARTSAGAAGESSPRVRSGRTGPAIALSIAGLIVAAGWAVLFGLTESRCYALPDGSGCGSGLISPGGVAVELTLLGLAIAIAAVAARRLPATRG